MYDRRFLSWLHVRLVYVHGENCNMDYMAKLRPIIAATPAGQITPNTAPDVEGLTND